MSWSYKFVCVVWIKSKQIFEYELFFFRTEYEHILFFLFFAAFRPRDGGQKDLHDFQCVMINRF